MKIIIAVTFLVVFCAQVFAEPLPSVSPDEAGFSESRLARLNEVGVRYLESGKLPNVITMVNRGGQLVHFNAMGQHGVEDDTPLRPDDLFRIYSMTKPVTAVAAMQLYEQGKFRLSDPISKFVPELKDLKYLDDNGELQEAAPITMRHLLTHTAGFSYGFNPSDPVDEQYRQVQLFTSKDLTEFAEKLAQLPLKFNPGERWHYSVAVDVTGLVIERISGQRFDRYLAENLFEPLGMKDTFFEVPADKLDRFVENHVFNRETLKPHPFGPQSFQSGVLGIGKADSALINFEKVTLYSGGAGLVSTAMDYMKFAEMLRAGGRFGDARILSPKTLKYMIKNHLPASIDSGGSGEDPIASRFRGFGFGLGFGVNMNPVLAGSLASEGEFSWGGAAGTIFWVDPQEDIAVVGFTQMIGSPWPFRDDLRTAIYQALEESYE